MTKTNGKETVGVSEFERFENTLDKLLAVSKKDYDEKLQDWKQKQGKKKRTAGKVKRKKVATGG